MAKIRHWFHVSHDINADPEVWRLTDMFGERALRLWLEILSIADRNDGSIPDWLVSESPQLRGHLARRCRLTGQRVAAILRMFDELLWTEPGTPHRVRNHAKYRMSRGAHGETLGISSAEPHSIRAAHQQRISAPNTASSSEEAITTPTEFASNGDGKKKRNLHQYSDTFEWWWPFYPKTNGSKKDAWMVWERKRREGKLLTPNEMAMAVSHETVNNSDWLKNYIKHPASWLNSERYVEVIELVRKETAAQEASQPHRQHGPDPLDKNNIFTGED